MKQDIATLSAEWKLFHTAKLARERDAKLERKKNAQGQGRDGADVKLAAPSSTVTANSATALTAGAAPSTVIPPATNAAVIVAPTRGPSLPAATGDKRPQLQSSRVAEQSDRPSATIDLTASTPAFSGNKTFMTKQHAEVASTATEQPVSIFQTPQDDSAAAFNGPPTITQSTKSHRVGVAPSHNTMAGTMHILANDMADGAKPKEFKFGQNPTTKSSSAVGVAVPVGANPASAAFVIEDSPPPTPRQPPQVKVIRSQAKPPSSADSQPSTVSPYFETALNKSATKAPGNSVPAAQDSASDAVAEVAEVAKPVSVGLGSARKRPASPPQKEGSSKKQKPAEAEVFNVSDG